MLALNKTHWQAIIKNDKSMDNIFFYGVTTTKIFCKPSCHSKAPKFTNTVIFQNQTEALKSGFRPCKRCQPTGQRVSNEIWVEQIKTYIQNNYSQKLTLTIIAENCHGSASNLQRIFTKYTQQSPTVYLNNLRLQKAQQLLCQTNDPLPKIAQKCGFNSSSYFNTKFKQKFNMTPLQYKESFLHK